MAWGDDLAELATTRGPALVGYASLLTGNVDRAQDLVQEALARAYGRPRASADLAWTEAYVRRAILNLFLDGYRRDRLWARRRHLFASPADAEPAAAADQLATSTADHVDLQAALATLPPRERACVVLRFYDDLTVPDVAARLGISEGAAKRYLSDGVHRLERVLGPVEPIDADDVAAVETVETVELRPGRRQP